MIVNISTRLVVNTRDGVACASIGYYNLQTFIISIYHCLSLLTFWDKTLKRLARWLEGQKVNIFIIWVVFLTAIVPRRTT